MRMKGTEELEVTTEKFNESNDIHISLNDEQTRGFIASTNKYKETLLNDDTIFPKFND